MVFPGEPAGPSFEQPQGSLLADGLFWLHGQRLFVAQPRAQCSVADILRFCPEALADSGQCRLLLYQVSVPLPSNEPRDSCADIQRCRCSGLSRCCSLCGCQLRIAWNAGCVTIESTACS